MPRKPMNENDPLVPQQIMLQLSLRESLKQAARKTGKSESQIVREALAAELKRNSKD